MQAAQGEARAGDGGFAGSEAEPPPSTAKPCTSVDGEVSSGGAQRHAAALTAQQPAQQAAQGKARAGGERQAGTPPHHDDEETAPLGEAPAQKFARLRRRLKLFEEQFRAQHGRMWTGMDLSYKSEVFSNRESRLRIKNLYQEYCALYKQFGKGT